MFKFKLPISAALRLRDFVSFQSIETGGVVVFLGVGKLFVDPKDNRGVAVLRAAGVTKSRVTLLWHSLVKAFEPTIVLDVGANYGEIALSNKYARNVEIHLFEPNPAVRLFLQRSADSHANRSQFTVHEGLVGDTIGECDFYIDRKWSGTSSAVGEIRDHSGYKGLGPETFERVRTRSTTIDAVLGPPVGSRRRILFKIDVEGYEERVWNGMQRTLAEAEAFAGILEYDRAYLQKLGTDPDTFLRSLAAVGSVRVFDKNGIREVRDAAGMPPHCDLGVASEPLFWDRIRFPLWWRRLRTNARK